jgi:hypothetical protein
MRGGTAQAAPESGVSFQIRTSDIGKESWIFTDAADQCGLSDNPAHLCKSVVSSAQIPLLPMQSLSDSILALAIAARILIQVWLYGNTAADGE